MSDSRNPYYWTIRFIVKVMMKIWLRFESFGAENIPSSGGCLIVTNHVSYIDPPAVSCGVPHRLVHFMARDTLSSSRIGRWFFTRIESIPLDRTKGDIAALRSAIKMMKSGRVVALFPEGTRSPDGKPQQAKGGVGFLVAKAETPVVPAYVAGSYRALPKGARFVRPGKVTITYGKPIRPDELADLARQENGYEAIGRLLMSRILALAPDSAPDKGS